MTSISSAYETISSIIRCGVFFTINGGRGPQLCQGEDFRKSTIGNVAGGCISSICLFWLGQGFLESVLNGISESRKTGGNLLLDSIQRLFRWSTYLASALPGERQRMTLEMFNPG